MFEIVKRDGRREQYDKTKLARSLVRAGVAPYMLAGILDSVAPNPDQDTGSLRANLESELGYWQPTAARRYAQTRRVCAFGYGALARGRLGLHLETMTRFGVGPGDTVWVGENGTWVPLAVETTAQIEPGQAWLHSAVLADMGINPGARLLATGVCPVPLRQDGSCVPVDRHHAMVIASPP
jgi:hypothetical protein